MAGTLNAFTRTSKVFYERTSNLIRSGMQGIEQFFFSTPNVSTQAEFAIDRLIVHPWGVAFRRAGEQSAVRNYKPGIGTVIEVPRTSEKTPVTELMRDAVIVGIEELTAQQTHQVELFNQIVRQHSSAHIGTKAKLAIDTMRTGIFSPVGLEGSDIGLSYDFGRDASLDKTYDFTAGGATIDEALGNLYDAYRAKGGNPRDMAVLMGSSWLDKLMQDATVLERMRTNAGNYNIITERVPQEFNNTQGLYLVGQYLIPGRVTPIWILGYSPEDQYIEYEGATPVDFFPANEALIFSVGSTRYRVLRGVDVFNDAGQEERVVGDLVFDTYKENDPITTWLRSQTRYIFVPANVDHTGRSVGTF